jgi:transposase
MQVFFGIDWGHSHHEACFLDQRGQVLSRLTVAHTADGLTQLERAREQLGVTQTQCQVGLETAHTLLIDFLWDRGYRDVFVIPPGAIKGARRRYRQTNAHTDQSDAFLVADVLRTDPATLRPWRPDGLIIRQLRSKVSLLHFLTKEIRRLSNRLGAVLARYYPAGLHVFHDIASPIALQFVQAYPTPEAAACLNRQSFGAFARAHRYRQADKVLSAAYARLQAAYPATGSTIVVAYQEEALFLAHHLLAAIDQKKREIARLQELFEQHDDHELFAALPGTGDFLAPALLAKFGDDRERFPSAGSLQSLAGTCPVTEQSGKGRRVVFRQACDHEFRQIAQQWAKASVSQSSWASTYWHSVRDHSRSSSHAYRCLANRWLAIAWKCWQSRQPYDEAIHLQNRARRLAKRA